MRNDQAMIKNFIEAQFSQGAKVLDIGCYTGDFLYSLPPQYEKCGVEKCVSAVQRASQSGIKIVGNDLYGVRALTDRFDVVIAMDVIEHVVNPDQFLCNALSILFEDSLVLITTGDSDDLLWRRENAAFWYCALAEHISFISGRWLQWNASVSGFCIEHLQKIKYEDRAFWKVIAMRCLAHLYPLFCMRVPPMWAAHASKDHLFAAIRQEV